MRELGANILFLPATCDVLGMNYVLMLLFVLGYGIFRAKLNNKRDTFSE